MPEHRPPVRKLLEATQRMQQPEHEIPLSIVVTFLGVAVYGAERDAAGEALGLEDIAARLNVPPTTISQHLRYLGDYYRFGKPGLGLVRTWENPDNRRKKVAALTPKGRGLVRQLELLLRAAGARGQ